LLIFDEEGQALPFLFFFINLWRVLEGFAHVRDGPGHFLFPQLKE